jgi:hypothetical protein
MKLAFAAAILAFSCLICLPARAGMDPGDRRWFALAVLSLVSQEGSSEPGIFYSSEYQFEPGILVRTKAEDKLTLSLGITENTFTLGPSLRIGKSRYHLSGGVASEQDRVFTFPFACLSWRWNVYY